MPHKIVIDETGKKLTISFLNKELATTFVEKLQVAFPTMKLPDKFKFKYPTPQSSTLLQGCYWENMPSFDFNPDILTNPKIEIVIDRTPSQLAKLKEALDTKITDKTISTWVPEKPKEYNEIYMNNIYISDDKTQPKYPIYILSKGRWEKRFTSRWLDESGIDYKIVIEPQEVEEYLGSGVAPEKILILPEEYLNKNQGGIPARNFIWKHSTEAGHKKHWVLDDNIKHYQRLIHSQRVICKGSFVFRYVEDYVDRFTNIKMAGHQYSKFVVAQAKTNIRPIIKNTRVYSSILLSNDIPSLLGETEMWRGKYNEDVDLSIRVLKGGFGTVLFQAISAEKETTMKQKGGNTSSIYAVENYSKLKTQSLIDQHPDICKMVERYGRIHHEVDYSAYENNEWGFIEDSPLPKGDYGMYLIKR